MAQCRLVRRRPDSAACQPELVFMVAGERVALHRALAAARSPLLRRQLLGPWAQASVRASSPKHIGFSMKRSVIACVGAENSDDERFPLHHVVCFACAYADHAVHSSGRVLQWPSARMDEA